MPNAKKILLYLLSFLIVGEIMIRIDKKFEIMQDRRIVKILADIELTPEYKMLINDSGNFGDQDLKILVIGDSYIHGGGIEFDNTFSQNLKRIANKDKGKFENVWVLDVSVPSSNNLDNYLTYFKFTGKYDPDIVILGYNDDDVTGNLDIDTLQENGGDLETIQDISGLEAKSTIKKIYNIIYKSELVHFIFHKIHNNLKAIGIIIPNSNFDLIHKSYYQNKENWEKSKIFLKEMAEHAHKNDIQLIIYKFPEINLIEHPKLFKKSNEVIKSFFSDFESVCYLDGGETFKNCKSEDYRLSKYDGHPNEKAHRRIAEEVFDLIKKTNLSYNN